MWWGGRERVGSRMVDWTGIWEALGGGIRAANA